jgi:hypothetical protein
MSEYKVKLYVAFVIDAQGTAHVDAMDEWPERVTFNSLVKADYSKVDFDLRRIDHLDKFCTEHGFSHGVKIIDVDLLDDSGN